MSSGGWEVVGKNKKDKNVGRTNKLTKVAKKKFIENAPKVEDFRKLIGSFNLSTSFLNSIPVVRYI